MREEIFISLTYSSYNLFTAFFIIFINERKIHYLTLLLIYLQRFILKIFMQEEIFISLFYPSYNLFTAFFIKTFLCKKKFPFHLLTLAIIHLQCF